MRLMMSPQLSNLWPGQKKSLYSEGLLWEGLTAFDRSTN
jgi:hypothetical protein